jgi:hypothetical protein
MPGEAGLQACLTGIVVIKTTLANEMVRLHYCKATAVFERLFDLHFLHVHGNQLFTIFFIRRDNPGNLTAYAFILLAALSFQTPATIPHAIVKCDTNPKQYSFNSFCPRSIQEVSAYICSRPSCLFVCSSVCLFVGIA